MDAALMDAVLWVLRALAAIVSIGGAVFSWRFASKAKAMLEASAYNSVAEDLLRVTTSTKERLRSLEAEMQSLNAGPEYRSVRQKIVVDVQEYAASVRAAEVWLVKNVPSLSGARTVFDKVAGAMPESSAIEAAIARVAQIQGELLTAQRVRLAYALKDPPPPRP